eukprot:3988994-Prorocentrum_lima.AAC.1
MTSSLVGSEMCIRDSAMHGAGTPYPGCEHPDGDSPHACRRPTRTRERASRHHGTGRRPGQAPPGDRAGPH